MYAVIFRAEFNEPDEDYFTTATKLRELALSSYGCTEFSSITKDGHEIVISYWENVDQIKAWKKDKEHIQAQKMGRKKWYKQYKVEIVKIEHAYSKGR